MRLSARDVSRLLSFGTELKELDDVLAFPPHVLAGLRRLIPADKALYQEHDPAEGASILEVWSADGEEGLASGLDDEHRRHSERRWRVLPTHPLWAYRTRSRDWTHPLKVSDFATLPEFRRTVIYEGCYRGSLDYWLDVGLPATATRTRLLILTRQGGRDFDESHRLVLELLQPHLEARAAAVENAALATASLASVEEQATDETHRVVLCSARGTIEFASASSRELLRRYVGVDNGRLPTALLGRRTAVLPRGSGRLTIRVAKAGDLRVLVLEERDTRVDRLTVREREIVDRAARGETNAQIAFELQIATATVAKHLEHAYRKLGVGSRTAAAALIGK